MNIPIVVFYHCLFCLGDPPEEKPAAFAIVHEFVACLRQSRLLDEASEFIVGINGGAESEDYAKIVLPPKAQMVFHGLQSRAENLTLLLIEKWVKEHPGQEAYFLYAHAKGCTHPPESSYATGISRPWRQAMTSDLVMNWPQCVGDLNMGADIVCSRWLWNMGSDQSQHIPAGNFLWVKASFVQTLPSMYLRERIKNDGIAAVTSRYEAEVYWGNGPRKPIVRQYRPNGGGGIP